MDWEAKIIFVYLLAIGSIGAKAGEIKNAALCAPLLEVKNLKTEQLPKSNVDFFGRPFISDGLKEDWVKVGSDDGALFLNLESLQSTNHQGYLKANGHNGRKNGSRYIPLIKSRSGQHLVLTRGEADVLAPLMLANAAPSDRIYNLAAQRELFSFDGFYGLFKYNPDETLLAYSNGVHDDIWILDSEDSTLVAHFKSSTPIRFFEWSAEDSKTLLLMTGEDPHIKMIRYHVLTNAEELVMELRANEPFKKIIFRYSPEAKKMILSAVKEDASRIFVFDEHDGNGESVDIPLEINDVNLSHDGRLLGAVNSFSVYVHHLDNLSTWGETPRTYPQLSHVIHSEFNKKSQLAVIRWDGHLELFEIRDGPLQNGRHDED